MPRCRDQPFSDPENKQLLRNTLMIGIRTGQNNSSARDISIYPTSNGSCKSCHNYNRAGKQLALMDFILTIYKLFPF